MVNELINSAACRKMALRWVERYRPGWGATRVSQGYLDDLNIKVGILIKSSISKHRSVGKTVMDFN